MLDIVCAEKDVEGTYKVVKYLLDNVGTMYDFRKSDRKSTRLNSSHIEESRMPSSA